VEVSTNILEYLKKIYDKKTTNQYLEFINSEPSQYLRVNTLKTNPSFLSEILFKNYKIKCEPVPGIPNCLKVVSGNKIAGKTVQHIVGGYYIQSLSSMLPPIALNPNENNTVLDLCSAPGSKTTQLGEIMKNNGTLIANEIALDRVKMLVFNIDRMNLINTGVVHSKGELLSKIYCNYFDKILVDAPCSGLGIIQKKNEVNDWWSAERTSVLGDLQLRLLIAAIKMVKPEGEIVYSTCTLTVEENELILNKVLEKYPVELIDIDLPIKTHDAYTYYNETSLNPSLSKARRVWPWEINSEGFFIAKLKKIGNSDSLVLSNQKKNHLQLLSFDRKEIQKTLSNLKNDFNIEKEVLNNYNYLIKGKDIFFVNKNWSAFDLNIFQRIGTRFGIIDKNGKTVLHTQAAQVLNNEIKKNIYEVENPDELRIYLDGGTIKKQIDYTGQCVIKYNKSVLGTAIITKQGIKSRFPRSKRTQEILIEA
jgi:16S rRNA (cytosine1407-C5)-methyltransferase